MREMGGGHPPPISLAGLRSLGGPVLPCLGLCIGQLSEEEETSNIFFIYS